MTRYKCPVCGRLVESYAARNSRSDGTHRRFDLHRDNYNRNDCPMSDEPVGVLLPLGDRDGGAR